MQRQLTSIVIPWSACMVLAAWIGPSRADEDANGGKLPPSAAGEIDFRAKIEPIFEAKCHMCHGPDVEEAGLRLDVKARALSGGDSGPVILPGKSAASPIVRLVAELEEGERMPPEGEGEPLTDEEISLIRAWIDQGAHWPDDADGEAAAKGRGADHWAFQPIAHPEPPAVKGTAWVHNGIDAFILRKLEQEGVEPAPEADRPTLIRRLSIALVGLPPTPAETAQFVTDPRPDAYQRLVDRLLDSPAYGERWARHWLDLARYADSDGYEKDLPRPHAWRWRDWVIKALNDDLPFDRFTMEQLAGDLLPGATTEQKVATGFHRNTLINREGGIDQEEDRVKRTVDRTNTVGSVWLGMTVECAQCHTHKYDPLTQREYFGLYAFFNSLNEPDIRAPLAKQLEEYLKVKTAFDREHAQHLAAIGQYEKSELAAAQAAWEKSGARVGTDWTVLSPTRVTSYGGSTLSIQSDQSVLAEGANPESDVYTFVAKTDLSGITAIRLEVLPDDSLTNNGPGRSYRGNFVLSGFRVAAAPAMNPSKQEPVVLDYAQADHSQPDWPVTGAIDDDPKTGWAIADEFGKPHAASFETVKTIGFDGGTTLTVTLDHEYGGVAHNIGRFRLSVTTDPRPVHLSPAPESIAAIAATAPEKRSPDQQQELARYYETIDPGLHQLRRAAARHAKKASSHPGEKVMAQVVAELGKPRETRVHIRGNFLTPGDPVEPHTPAVLPPLPARGEHADRLDLARWLIDPANPLTARVTVNRIWQRHFGRGLVATSNNFGTQGDEPSHPELLDWLATRFRDQGWSLKSLHRLMVTSATYRQSSVARPELAQRDPYNAWLARQNRLRAEAEVIRDLALAASGLLHAEVGGESVRPPQSEGLAMLGYAGEVKWPTSGGHDRYRRGLYTFFQRTVPYPMLITFDAPDSNIACTRRERSNTPLQSLTLWNDPVFFECAQALGRRIAAGAASSADAESTVRARIAYAFRLSLGREPSAEEFSIVHDLYNTQLVRAQQDPSAAAELIGDLPGVPDVPQAELAAWITVGRTLINLDEFITRE